MAMVLGSEVADSVGGEGTASSMKSKIGLNSGQKLGAINRALPRPKTSHPYVVGSILIVVGMFSLVGSLTGTLPSMIAALFVPNALVDQTGANAPSPGILGQLTKATSTAIDPLAGIL